MLPVELNSSIVAVPIIIVSGTKSIFVFLSWVRICTRVSCQRCLYKSFWKTSPKFCFAVVKFVQICVVKNFFREYQPFHLDCSESRVACDLKKLDFSDISTPFSNYDRSRSSTYVSFLVPVPTLTKHKFQIWVAFLFVKSDQTQRLQESSRSDVLVLL